MSSNSQRHFRSQLYSNLSNVADLYHFESKNIVVLSDDNEPGSVAPTKDTIVGPLAFASILNTHRFE